MGIYIKGMEMPVSCWYCDPDFAYAINCNEWKRDDFPHFTTSRPDTCPLIESAEANSDDLIIKGAKGIQDGLYNIKDGKLFKYKAKGGTVRTYEIVPSADAEDRLYIKIYADDEPSVKAEKLYQICGETQNRDVAEWLKEYFQSAEPKTGEWKPKNHHTDYCSNCGFEDTQWRTADYNFCPSCGARMKGADDAEGA